MPDAKGELFKLVNTKLASPSFRKSFSRDPLGALKASGVDIAKIPQKQLDVLASLSKSELDVLSRVSIAAEAAGDTSGYVVF